MSSRTSSRRDLISFFKFGGGRRLSPGASIRHSLEALESRIAPASLAGVAETKSAILPSGADVHDVTHLSAPVDHTTPAGPTDQAGASVTAVPAATAPILAVVAAPSVTIAASPSVFEDGNATITFTFTRQGSLTAPLTASFSLTGSATLDSSDYTLSGADLTSFVAATGTGTVTFAAGSATATVVVNPTDDTVVEPTEQINFTVLAGSGGYVVGNPSSDLAFIFNDDTDVRVIVSPGAISEDGGATLVYTLVRTGVTGGTLNVNFSTSGTALPGSDYDLSTTFFDPVKGVGVATFIPEATTTTIVLKASPDNLVEADETAVINLTGGAGYGVVGPAASGLITNDDSTVSVAVNPGSVLEDAKTDLVYTFTRNGFTANSLTVDFSVAGTATFGATADYIAFGADIYSATAGTVTFASGSNTATVVIHPFVDTTPEADETVTLTLAAAGSTSTGGYTSVPPSAATGTILNDDSAVSVTLGATSIAESSTTGLIYTFTRTAPGSGPLTVNFSSSGTAAFGTDFAATSTGTLDFVAHTLIIPAGSASATITLTPIDDRSVEGTETATLTVLPGTGYGVGGSPATGSITDNDTATIGYGSATSTILEGAGNDALSLVLTITGQGVGTPSLERDVTFSVLTAAGGTATGGGTDYTLPALQTFAAGSLNSATKTVNLAIFNDALVEGSETANLGLALGTDGTGGQVTIATGAGSSHVTTITDNDTATIGYITATSSVLESANNDLLGLLLTINANGTGPASLARGVTFNVTTTGGNATSADFTLPLVLSFPSGALSGDLQTANLGIIDDRLVEGLETTTSGLAIVTDGTGGQITIATGAPAAHVTTIVDNDSATFDFVSSTSTVGEAAGNDAVALKLTIAAIGTGPTALARDISLKLSTASGGSAFGGGVDYNLPATALTFTSGALDGATQSTNVAIANDTFIEGPETANFALLITSDGTGGRAAIGGTNLHTATINDDDTATISFATPSSTAPEAISSHSFDVKLVTSANGVAGAGTLASPVSVNVSVPAPGGGTATGGGVDYTFPAGFNLTFAAGSTDSSKPVSVTIVNDQNVEGPETVNFSLAAVSSTLGTSLVIDPTIHATTIVDNDADLTIGVTSAAGPVIAGSGSDNLSFTVTLTNFGKTDATNVAVSDLFTLPAGVTFSSATPGTGAFNSATGTWTVPAITANGGTATLTVALTADHSTANLASASLTASITSADQSLVNTSDDTANASASIARRGDLSVVVTDSPDPTGPLQQLTYTIVVSNNGPSDSANASIRDTFPPTLQAVTWTAAFGGGGSGNASGTGDLNELISIPAGGTVTYTATGTVTAAAAYSTIANTADVAGPRAQDPNPANDTATQQTTIGGIDLQLSQDDTVTSVQPGDVIKYTLTYLNGGFVTSTGARITDVVPVNTVFDAANSTAGWIGIVDGSAAGTSGNFDLGTLPVSTTPGTVIFAVRVTNTVAAGQISVTNVASISDDGLHGPDGKLGDNSTSDLDILNAAPDLHLLQTLNGVEVQDDGGAVARRGGLVTYTLSYSNEGNQDASGVVITQTLPANTQFFGGPWTETAPGSGTYTFDAGTVAAKDGPHPVSFTVYVKPVQPTHTTLLSTTASIDDGGINGVDPTTTDNSKTDTTPLYQGIYAITPGITVPKGFGPPTVLVFDAATGTQVSSFLAYEPNIRASIRVAVGDFNHDGFDDIATSSAKGTGRVRIFLADSLTGTTFTQSGEEIAAFDGKKAVGAFIAVGDVNEDRRDEIIVGSALGSGRLRVYDSVTHDLLFDAKPFGANFTGGVRVAAGDVDGDGRADIIAAQGYQGGRVKVYAGEDKFSEGPALGSRVLQDFSVGGKSYIGGLSVAAADLDGDGKADIITGRNSFSKPFIQTFNGTTHALLKSFLALPDAFGNGLRVAAADVNLDGIADIIVGAGFDGGSQVKIFDGATAAPLSEFTAFPSFPKIALWIAGSNPVPIADRIFD